MRYISKTYLLLVKNKTGWDGTVEAGSGQNFKQDFMEKPH